MTTWISRIDEPGDGPRLAVKDNIEVAGVPATAGCPAYARRHPAPSALDAAVVAALRAAGARVAGTVTLHELATGRTGVNRWFGTATNPLDPRLIPGGSSSGCAAAVGHGEAEIGVGTDTGGSVRTPAACCGVAGLKTTYGLLSREGVVPAAPSLDVVGFLARDVAGLRSALRMAGVHGRRDAAFGGGPVRVGRLRGHAAPALETAVDRALAATGWPVHDLDLPSFEAAGSATYTINIAEATALHGWMLDHPALVGADVAARLREGRTADLATALAVARRWDAELARAWREVDVIALPTLATAPPPVDEVAAAPFGVLTRPANLAGIPALALPLPGGPGLSLQLLAPRDGDEYLLDVGAAVEGGLG